MPTRRPVRSFLAALLCLGAGGCATSSSDPASLIPTQLAASVMAEDRLLGNANGGSAVSVDDMLARARQSGGDGSPPGQHATAQAATTNGPGEVTGSVGAPAASPTQAPVAARPAAPPALPPEPEEPKPLFEITFDGSEEQPPAAAKEAMAKKIKGARLSAKSEVTILTGPGPGTNAFEQAVLANRRARNVRSLLPEGWQIQQLYDPSFPPDTVRIVLGRVS
ncbi:hypothetical protein [Aquabacter cavernae]|uniref:hypothetical protein n=1 Tax=Aquabacter cavernae TaxID=2496029 RepID=UPI000F8D1E6C|nr:hypothetical protein [Aquabacter cavernae]